MAGAGDGSWDLSDDGPVFLGEFLAVEGLGVDTGAVVSHGVDGCGCCVFNASLGNIKVLSHDIGLDAGDWDGLGFVDENSSWDFLGGGGWVVDGLSACNLLVDGLKSGDLNWNLNGDLFLDNVGFSSGGGDWNLDDFLDLSGGGDWNLDDLGDLGDDGLWDLDDSGDLFGDGLWLLNGVALGGDGWDLSGGGDWDLLGDDLVSVVAVAPVVP